MQRIGTWGFGPHPWVSVERSRRFYAGALAEEFELVDLDAVPEGEPAPPVDAILSLTAWSLTGDLQEVHHPFAYGARRRGVEPVVRSTMRSASCRPSA